MNLPRSTAATPRPPAKKTFLFQGPPGGGKTTFALQFPGVAYIQLADHPDGPERFIRKLRPELDYAYLNAFHVDGSDKEAMLPIEHVFPNTLKLIGLAAKDSTVQCLVLDNLTNMDEVVYRTVCREQGKPYIDGAMWGQYKSKFRELLMAGFAATGKHCIIISHEKVLEKPHPDKNRFMETIITGYTPVIQGGVTDYFGGYFSDSYAFTVIPGVAGNYEHLIETVSTPLRTGLKSSMGLPAQIKIPKDKLAWDIVGSLIQPYL